MNRLQFVSYLRHTLIPDFREADMHATAEDFETALQFIAEDAARIEDLESALREAVAYIKAGYPDLEDTDETVSISADDGPEASFRYASAVKLLTRTKP